MLNSNYGTKNDFDDENSSLKISSSDSDETESLVFSKEKFDVKKPSTKKRNDSQIFRNLKYINGRFIREIEFDPF